MSPHPPTRMHEDLLRHFWSRQLFDGSSLSTTDGRSLRIIRQGTLSRKSGPDFLDAVIEINGVRYSGDIEFHRDAADWEHHGHGTDPRYNSVILHVVLTNGVYIAVTQSGRPLPTLDLEPYLSDAARMNDHLRREEFSSKSNPIPCTDVNASVPGIVLDEAVRLCYKERLQEKVRRMQERLETIVLHLERTLGEPRDPYPFGNEEWFPLPEPMDAKRFGVRMAWEQLLFEELLDCLGYANNRGPMKHLGELLPVHELSALFRSAATGTEPLATPSAQHCEALLFAVSGLLPSLDGAEYTEVRVYLHSLSVCLKEVRFPPAARTVHPAQWNFSPTRPANFPTIRIAAAGHLLHAILFGTLYKGIITLVGGGHSTPQEKFAALTAMLRVPPHPFWSDHYSFTESSLQQHSILGASRIHDIIVNALIPFVSLYAGIFRDEPLQEHCLHLAAILPLLEENSILKTMRTHLLKGRLEINTAYQQQGLLQLHKRYCTAGRCSECLIGQRVMPS